MNAEICLQKLERCGILSFATVDKSGAPQIRCISAIHYDADRLYFFTARGKAFCDELLADGRVQILAYTRFKEMIRLSGRAIMAVETEQAEKSIRYSASSRTLRMSIPIRPEISASFLS